MTDFIQYIENHRDQPLRDIIRGLIDLTSASTDDSAYAVLEGELKEYYKRQLAREIFPSMIRINNDAQPDHPLSGLSFPPRIVIIGDLHSDFNALSSILAGLAASEYDYFTNARLIFCGDYTDRGRRPFETLRLLYALRTLMGNRCIILRGNHELIRYSCMLLKPTFYPADTSQLMNRIFSPEVNNLYFQYLSRLPFLVSLTHAGRKFLIVHGSIPRHDYVSYYNENSLAECLLPVSEHTQEGTMLNQMLWGDPGDSSSSFRGTELRFEFSKSEFIDFMNRNGYDIMIRGHQPVDSGVMSCYNKRLVSLFSSGGHNNPDTFYPDDVSNPAFLIINEEGGMLFEKVF